jgi:hypothetical protein
MQQELQTSFEQVRKIAGTVTMLLTLFAMLLDSQSKPSYRPSPDVAHVLWMYLKASTLKDGVSTASIQMQPAIA